MIRIVILTCFAVYMATSVTVLAEDVAVQEAPPAQASPTTPAGNSGREVLARRCFQCHPATMWSSVRGDRRAWLGVLYRMVGRGAYWTQDEINAMADFLAETRGPKK